MDHDPDEPEISRRIDGEPRVSPSRWVVRVVFALLALVVGLIAWQVFKSAAPREWSHWVGAKVDESQLRGLAGGLGIGFVFTVLPLALVFQIRRRFFSWAWRGIIVMVALVIATPNWLTLWVALGSSEAAKAARGTLDVKAPWFQGASLAGAIAGGLLATLLLGTSMVMKYRKDQVRELQAELDERHHRHLKGDDEIFD
jgi:hypothetical protein